MPKAEASFVESVLKAFKKINEELHKDSLEHDFSPRFADYFVRGVLGYQGKEYSFERGRTDITLLDENGLRAVLIETKRPKEELNAEKWQNQAGKYADANTHFIGLTNGYRLLIWEVQKNEKILKADIDFKSIIESKKLTEEKLSTKEIEQMLFLENLRKEQVWNASKYSKFNDYYAIIDVFEENGFNQLIEQLNFISNNLLKQYTFNAFDEYLAGYLQYRQTKDELEKLKKINGKNSKHAADLARFELKTEGKFKKYSDFQGYFIWKALSNRPEGKEEENKQVFCKESIYLLINRLLFIRICEDKGLLGKKISNGGIEKLREQLSEPILGNTGVFKQIVQFSYGGAKNIYNHFYEKDNPLDWYESSDGELDKVLNKVLWLLNQFNFSKVDRDILGKLYEKYLPKDERKKLGEFYTPDEVIDYILDAVEFVPSKSIEGKDLIDPACGSGGFLVKAARRLIARHAVKAGKATPKEALDNKKWPEVLARLSEQECEEIVLSVAGRIHGFDINPFAVSITEMNLLFQIIDLYSKAVKKNLGFKIPRFNVFETDSLELPSGQTGILDFSSPTGQSLAKDKTITDELKNKKYDYVVGNPPWLGILKMQKASGSAYNNYESAVGKFDIYVLFIELGIKLMKETGKLGYITQNRFMKVDYAKKLREFIKKNSAIKQIIDFGDIKIFEDATNYPCIMILEKGEPDNFQYVDFKPTIKFGSSGELLLQVKKHWEDKQYDDNNFKISTIKQAEIENSAWAFNKQSTIIKRTSNSEALSKYVEKMVQGVTCGGENSDKIFYVTKTSIENFRIEEKLLKNVIRGKNIRKYYAENSETQLLYPYEITGNPIDLKMYPSTAKYLNQFKDKLAGRTLDGKSITEWNKQWFELWRQRKPEIFERPKIICPRIAEKNRFALDNTGAYLSDSAIAIIPKGINIHLLLGLLNSKLLEHYITTISPYVQGKYYNYSKSYVEQLPIKLPSNSKEQLIADKIIDLVKEIVKIKKKENSDTSKLEAQVDDLVFRLYGLSEEERGIVEDSLGT